MSQYYDLEVKQGAQSNDEESLRNEIIMELAVIEGYDPKQLSNNQKKFKKVLANTLEKILIKNNYKSKKVTIDKRFSTTNPTDLINAYEGSSEFELPKFIQYKAKKNKVVGIAAKDSHSNHNDSEQGSNIAINIDDIIPLNVRRNYIKENIIKVMDRKTVLKTIKDANKPLSSQNIPYLSSETNFSRAELHAFYTIYKALCHATSQLYDVMKYSS